jgi:hypothetical protein
MPQKVPRMIIDVNDNGPSAAVSASTVSFRAEQSWSDSYRLENRPVAI